MKSSIAEDLEEHLMKFTEIVWIKLSNRIAADFNQHPTRLTEVVMIE
jgi:hypothetical protein